MDKQKYQWSEISLPPIEFTISEVKLCPFCGKQAECVSHHLYGKVKGYFVYCKKCGVQQGKIYKSKQMAIKAWNRRVNNG